MKLQVKVDLGCREFALFSLNCNDAARQFWSEFHHIYKQANLEIPSKSSLIYRKEIEESLNGRRLLEDNVFILFVDSSLREDRVR